MKRSLGSLITTLAFLSSPLLAEVDVEDVGSENVMTATGSTEEAGPFKIDANGDYVCKAKAESPYTGNLLFDIAQVSINAVYYYNPCYKEGLAAAAQYQRTRLDWNANPYFNQSEYNTASLILGAFTERVCDWLWRGQVSLNFDNLDYWNFSDYMTYDIVLWGRYACCDNIGINIGFFAETGMKMDRLYPIIGIDWEPSCNWKISAVFPTNISLTYLFSSSWSVALAGRFFDERHRTKKNEPVPQATWRYQSSGAEFGINFDPGKWLHVNIHAGHTFRAWLKVGDKNYNHRRRIHFDGAPYAGADLYVNF